MTKTVYLMRHGQTLFNQLSKIQGFCDSPLTEFGVAQAQFAKKYFEEQGIHFDAAYSSTLERAEDTLELITQMPYTRLKGIKEWNFGSVEGESESLNPPLPYQDFFVKYGGEEEKEFQRRITSTIFDIMDSTDDESVLMVVHGAVLGQFMKYWIDHSKVQYRPGIGNCAIFKYEFTPEKKFVLQEIVEHDFSDIKHLDLKGK